MPKWVRGNKKYEFLWKHPWRCSPSRMRHRAFKKALYRHGYLSPHFTLAETSSRGTKIPKRHRRGAQKCAFKAEKVRHDCDDRPLPILSWYRTPGHNADVGGASNSRHMKGDAFDPGAGVPPGFNASARKRFGRGGIGTGCSSGNVQHCDSRSFVARWCYPGR